MTETLPGLLADASDQRPDHAAVEDASGVCTYRELARWADFLAAELAESGVEPGDRVGVLVSKNRFAVACLYGVMWAGSAYVPLPITMPVSRLIYMIRDCKMSALVTTPDQFARVAAHLVDTSLRRVILLDPVASGERTAEPCPVPTRKLVELPAGGALGRPHASDPGSLAYILYTSGSTGTPKGVMISHRNALAFVEWAQRSANVSRDDRISSHAPFHFDLSVFDLYVSALSQATVVLVPEGRSVFPMELAQWIEDRRISVWYSVPSILIDLLGRGRVERFDYASLKTVLFAGEVFLTKHLRAWMNKLPRAVWLNFYGPTETNVCTYYEVPAPPEGDAAIPIGRAASRATIHLRDESGDPITQAGIPGEICVSGPTVAQGYWNDEQKTSDRFVVDRQLTGSDVITYRTGDIGCWDEKGDLLFRGRRDAMVKVRGYRIELGEIEVAAASHPAVREVGAIAVPDAMGGNVLHLFLSLRSARELSQRELQRHLVERLPRYMLPKTIHFLDDLPKTSTAKIDRRGLARTVSGTE